MVYLYSPLYQVHREYHYVVTNTILVIEIKWRIQLTTVKVVMVIYIVQFTDR